MKIAIIGAGPAGLTAAYELSKHGNHTIHIYEASSTVGGMCKTISLWNTKVDIGPHRFFSHDKKVNKLWLEVVGSDYKMVNRSTRIFFRNKFFDYPIKPLNALRNIGILDALLSITSYFFEKGSSKNCDNNFETWVQNRFGKKLYELFFKTYSEKLWGIKCTELDADFAAQRIKKLSLFEVLKNSLFIFSKKNVHKTLVDQFAYPLNGTGMVYEKMLAKLLENNPDNQIFLNTKIKGCATENRSAKGIILEDGSFCPYDAIVSTMPLTKLVLSIPEAPQEVLIETKKLTFRNTIIVYLKVEGIDLFPDNWLYIHSSNLQLGRVTNFRNWVPELYGQSKFTVLALEYWCNPSDEFWNSSNEHYIALAKKEIIYTGLLKGKTISDAHVVKIPNCYPVYKIGYKESLKSITAFLDTITNLYPIGRYGSFKYNNQDHSILMGVLASEKILTKTPHDLWGLNTDYNVYQENTTIGATGLVEND